MIFYIMALIAILHTVWGAIVLFETVSEWMSSGIAEHVEHDGPFWIKVQLVIAVFFLLSGLGVTAGVYEMSRMRTAAVEARK